MSFNWRPLAAKSKNGIPDRPPRECKVCKQTKALIIENFMRIKRSAGDLCPKKGFMDVCRECITKIQSQMEYDPRGRLIYSAKSRAKDKGIPFDLKWSEIELPTKCVYLGVRIDYTKAAFSSPGKRRPYGASIDRIIPSLGYVKGNVQIISDLANRMKQDATIEELLAFANGIIKQHGPKEIAKPKKAK